MGAPARVVLNIHAGMWGFGVVANSFPYSLTFGITAFCFTLQIGLGKPYVFVEN